MNRNKTENDRYVDDMLAFVDLLKGAGSAPRVPGGPSPRGPKERADLAELYARLREDGRSVLCCGTDIGLESLARKHKLDDVETLILMVLAHGAIHGDDEMGSGPAVRRLVRMLAQLTPQQAYEYWRWDAKLLAEGLTAPPPRSYMRLSGLCDYQILPGALDVILGRARPARARGVRLTPAGLYEKLGTYVMGQERARRVLATAVYKHGIVTRLNRRRKGVDRLQRANVLLLGPTGTGKTHLCRSLAQVLGLPLLITDATQYTETGYVGGNVEEMLEALAKKGDCERGGIIFIDEIDKIAARSIDGGHNSNRDVSGLSVQQELLKMLDGDSVTFKGVEYDVSRILFIAGGAFSGLEQIVSARLKRRAVGFLGAGGGAEGPGPVDLRDAATEDLLAYGFSPEFIGRFASITGLDPLGKEELIGIMTGPRNSIVSQYQALFKASGVDLRVPRESLEWVAEQALRNGTGARGLKAVLESALMPVLFEKGSGTAGRKEALRPFEFSPERRPAPPEGLQA